MVLARVQIAVLEWNHWSQKCERVLRKTRETWRRTTETETEEVGETCNKMRFLAQNKSEYRKIVCAYASRVAQSSRCRSILKLSKN